MPFLSGLVQPTDTKQPIDRFMVRSKFCGRAGPRNAATFHDQDIVRKIEGALNALLDQKDRHVAGLGQPRKSRHQLLADDRR